MQPFSLNQTGTLLRRHLAQFVAAIDSRTQVRLAVRKGLLNRVEVGAVWREIKQVRACSFNPLSNLRLPTIPGSASRFGGYRSE